MIYQLLQSIFSYLYFFDLISFGNQLKANIHRTSQRSNKIATKDQNPQQVYTACQYILLFFPRPNVAKKLILVESSIALSFLLAGSNHLEKLLLKILGWSRIQRNIHGSPKF